MPLKPRSNELKKVLLDPRPICYVCLKRIDEEYEMAKTKVSYQKKNGEFGYRYISEKTLVMPLYIGNDENGMKMYRHRKTSCEPGSTRYMKKFGPTMRLDIKAAFAILDQKKEKHIEEKIIFDGWGRRVEDDN